MGRGIVLWQGYFQSVRPVLGRMLINVDVSTAAMYKPGRLIDIALETLPVELSSRGPLALSTVHGFPEEHRRRLQSFLSGVRINVDIPGRRSTGRQCPRMVKKLTILGANQIWFTTGDGKAITISKYFENKYNVRLQFPDIVCIEVIGLPLGYGLTFRRSDGDLRSVHGA